MLSKPSTALNRRTLMKLAAASAALAACAPNSKQKKKHVAVIGGGIIGSSIAYHLAREGVQVTLLERGRLSERASQGTFAWINATWAKQPRHYHQFSQDGLTGWKRLQAELNIPIRWGGSLEWFPSADRQERLVQQIAEQAEWGEPASMISGDALASLEPNVDFGDAERVAYSANDGALDPVLVARMLADAAIKLGAGVRENCEVEDAVFGNEGRVTLSTSCGDVQVDDYVLATGADTSATKMLADLEVPQRTTPGVIVVTKPMPRLINRIIVAPGVHIHQREDGRVVLGEQDGAPDTAAHAQRLVGRPTRFPEPVFAEQHASRILAIAEQFVPGMGSAEIEDVFIGWRPLPLDGHPVLGRSPNRPKSYVAIMHSGVSLAPVVGELVAREIVTGQTAPGLDDYRPDRSIEAVRRY